MKNMVPITEWASPNEIMETQYGVISYERWLLLEAARIKKEPGRTVEIRKRLGKLAIFVDNRAEDEMQEALKEARQFHAGRE